MSELNSSLGQLGWLLSKNSNNEPQGQHQHQPESTNKTKEVSSRKKDEKQKSPDDRPPHSYSQLIKNAILNSPNERATLSSIYRYIADRYPYYRENRNPCWKNSVRHNLSLNKQFQKEERRDGESGKGSYWKVVPVEERRPKFFDGNPVHINPAVLRMLSRGDSRESQNSQSTEEETLMDIRLPAIVLPSPPATDVDTTDQENLCDMTDVDDISAMTLFETHDLSASFRAVYDQIFQNKRPSNSRQMEAQIDWFKISLEAVGMDYRDEQDADNIDTQRFISLMESQRSSKDAYYHAQQQTNQVPNGGIPSNHQTSTRMSAEDETDEIEDDFDWSTIVS